MCILKIKNVKVSCNLKRGILANLPRQGIINMIRKDVSDMGIEGIEEDLLRYDL